MDRQKAAPGSPIQISKLDTEYSKGHVRITIELTPREGLEFDVPDTDIVKEIGPCLKYIMFRFTGQSANGKAPVGQPIDPAEIRKKEAAEKERVDSMIAEGQARSLQGFEKALERAKKGGNAAEIADAKLALTRVQARIRATEAG